MTWTMLVLPMVMLSRHSLPLQCLCYTDSVVADRKDECKIDKINNKNLKFLLKVGEISSFSV